MSDNKEQGDAGGFHPVVPPNIHIVLVADPTLPIGKDELRVHPVQFNTVQALLEMLKGFGLAQEPEGE